MFETSISMEDVEKLEVVHAKLKSGGWVIPDWLIALRAHVEERDKNVS